MIQKPPPIPHHQNRNHQSTQLNCSNQNNNNHNKVHNETNSNSRQQLVTFLTENNMPSIVCFLSNIKYSKKKICLVATESDVLIYSFIYFLHRTQKLSSIDSKCIVSPTDNTDIHNNQCHWPSDTGGNGSTSAVHSSARSTAATTTNHCA